jgi:hypothetical protein
MTSKFELYRCGEFWVRETSFGKSKGFEVLRDSDSFTHATRVASIGYPGAKGLNKAITEANRRDKESR